MIREDLITVVEVLIVGPMVIVVSAVVWAVWGIMQTIDGARHWWSERSERSAA